ncbi:TRAP transporter large permease [Aeromicrobium sp. CTD01-1L150]|uniref:TRAP transporter large permease n=1 Tax=Aeromicrobium sp. CTD01-1L150 TaxID=3341830 RepID=UPI0035C02671
MSDLPSLEERSTPEVTRRGRGFSLGVSGVLYVVAALSGSFIFLVDDRAWQGGLALILMLALIALNVPIGIVLILTSALGLWGISGWNVASSTLQTTPFDAVSSWTLSVLPMFIFMGFTLWRAGVTEQLYSVAQLWFYWLPGGRAATTNAVGAGLSAVSGSTLGITYALARIGLPEMLRAGYSPRFATGAVLTAGTVGQLIPPSILMVVYAGIATVPVGPQLFAGVVPGLILAAGYGALIIVLAALKPSLAPRLDDEAERRSGRLRATARIWPVPALMVLVVGGIFGGFFTPTEAGAYGALGSVLIAAGLLGMRAFVDVLRRATLETAITTASIMLLIIGATMMTRMLSLSGLTRELTTYIGSLEMSRVTFLLLLIVVYLILGMFLESMAIMLLTVPIILPILALFDVSPLWFGAFVVLLGELALITPPVGILSFVVARIAKEPDIAEVREVTLSDVFLGGLWFLPVTLAVLVGMILFPGMVEWLPNMMR